MVPMADGTMIPILTEYSEYEYNCSETRWYLRSPEVMQRDKAKHLEEKAAKAAKTGR